MAKAPLTLPEPFEAQILQASYALPPAARTLFREQVLARLQDVPELGPGIVHRACAWVQRGFWTAPIDMERHHPRLFNAKR